MADSKVATNTAIDACRDELQELNSEIWRQPELSFQEYKAHDLLTLFLERKGFAVDRDYTGIETTFRATFGSGRPNVCPRAVMGTPEEEGYGRKVNLIENGAFADVDIAMMLHPALYSVIRPDFAALQCYTATFTGKAAQAHAAFSPGR